MGEHTIGSYLGARLQQMGIGHYFVVPGDYNLTLLDEIAKVPGLELIGCCNELNAGYAADGYARARGAGVAVVTFSVGGLSVVNAVAGSFAEDLPVVIVSGGPNTEDASASHQLHHTLGRAGDYSYVRDMFAHVTCGCTIIEHLKNAPVLIDRAIASALRERKPVYIEVACNLAACQVAVPVPYAHLKTRPQSDPGTLAASVKETAAFLRNAEKPVLLAGSKLRAVDGAAGYRLLAETIGCAVAVTPDAKGFFPETHPQWIGTYWGTVSSPGCAEIVESSDAILAAGCTFTDYTTTGYSALMDPEKLIDAGADRVVLPGKDFSGVYLADFLPALARQVEQNDWTLAAFHRVQPSQVAFERRGTGAPLSTSELYAQIEELVAENSTIVAETGDSWFNGIKMKLAYNAAFEIQMLYGSIGWSVGATLGYALGAGDNRQVLAMIGDGSFQLTAQEVSTMIRNRVRVIIFLINNGGYAIEEQIHSGPYNVIKNWDYASLVTAFNAADGNGLGLRATTAGTLADAIGRAKDHNGVSLIECVVDMNDCSKELLEWGSRIEAANSRPPRAA